MASEFDFCRKGDSRARTIQMTIKPPTIPPSEDVAGQRSAPCASTVHLKNTSAPDIRLNPDPPTAGRDADDNAAFESPPVRTKAFKSNGSDSEDGSFASQSWKPNGAV